MDVWRPIPGWKSSLPAVSGDGLDAMVAAHPAVAVHFWAEWNGVDPPMDRCIRAVEEQFAGRVWFMACDIDQQENVALCKRFGVVTVPTLGVVTSARPPRLLVGYRKPEELARAIEELLKPEPPAWWQFWRRKQK